MTDTQRYICIHGHFYQPPRENPWLEDVEWQDSAYPYHDWNERVTAECYLPNAASRILDGEGYISRIVSNYARMSFNFGPTLLAWMEKNDNDLYRAVIKADRESCQRFSGHGSAMAQAYNHLIMPLANHRDRYSQVVWGIRDFEHRYGRKPEGMWLPETAVDLETLDILAQLGIRFTILAPHQVRRTRRIGTSSWKDVSGGRINTTRAYRVNLPSGRRISIFFYDGPIAAAVSFEDILENGDNFANRLLGAFPDAKNQPQLVHIATDGENYGHHHRFADMALAYVLERIEANGPARLTNYGEFLERFPPAHEAEIIEKTSWSCAHGIDRWWSNCGDSTGSGNHPEWNQKWRTPLRNAFDWLRDGLAGKYEEKAGQLLKDPWAARDGYIDVILDRSPDSVNRFFSQYAGRELNAAERMTALKLLELQRHAMLMYTSCGWYFDELSRPEPVQVIQYAGRVVQLAQDLFGDDTEEGFLEILEQAKSNIPEQGDGRHIYNSLIKPTMINLKDVAAHYAVSSLFEEHGNKDSVYCYAVDNEDYRTADCGRARLTVGRSRVTSDITEESAVISFGAFHSGDYDVIAGAIGTLDADTYRTIAQEMTGACSSGDFSGVTGQLSGHFGGSIYSLKSLFRDEQRKVLGDILEAAMSDANKAYRELFEHHFPPARILSELGGPVPKAFHSVAELIINLDLHRAVSGDAIDADSVQSLVNTASRWQITLDGEGIGYDYKTTLEKMMASFAAAPDDINKLKGLLAAVLPARRLPFQVDLWKAQNIFWGMLTGVYPGFRQKAGRNEGPALEWVKDFVALGQELSVRVE
jgi:alpha-amylase/alpha-mannosidase (GH57 family)